MEKRRRLRVLHIEDSELDHELALAHLRRGGLDVESRRVESEGAFRNALALEHWDAVLSDYNLPGFSGLAALEIVMESGRQMPFILLSGEIGEETAVEAMRNGASDYLLKNNMARLVPAVEHAISAMEARRARLASERELAASRKRLSELAQHLQTSVDSERAAIAREIHDDVGGSLTALNFDLNWIAARVHGAEVQQRLQSAQETLAHAIEASQRIMHNLRPAILEQGLVAALQWMASRFEKRTGVPCRLRASHDSLQLPPGVPLVAYRVAQEALTNVSKHAHATHVEVELSISGGVLTLEVRDDGRGLLRTDLEKARSFGIRGLHERAGTVGGWIDLASSARGTVLMLCVPLTHERREEMTSDFDDIDDDLDRSHDPSAWGSL